MFISITDDYVPIVKRSVGYIAMAIVFDDKGRVLLIQEAKPSIRGQWYIPAGRVEPGENLVVRTYILTTYKNQLFLCTQ